MNEREEIERKKQRRERRKKSVLLLGKGQMKGKKRYNGEKSGWIRVQDYIQGKVILFLKKIASFLNHL